MRTTLRWTWTIIRVLAACVLVYFIDMQVDLNTKLINKVNELTTNQDYIFRSLNHMRIRTGDNEPAKGGVE